MALEIAIVILLTLINGLLAMSESAPLRLWAGTGVPIRDFPLLAGHIF